MHEHQNFYLRYLYSELASEQQDEAMTSMLMIHYSSRLHYLRMQTYVIPFFACGVVFIARTRDINGRFSVLF